MKKLLLLLSLPFLLVLNSCKEDETIQVPPVYFNYVPTNIGNTITYDVDSTYYNEFDSSVAVFHFQIMERIDSTYIDNQGRPTQRIERFKRDSVSGPWYPVSTWNSTLTTARFERVENNMRYVKLGFPISSSTTWNGNAYNTLGYEEYYYDTYHEPFSIATFSFDSVSTVIQVDDNNLIHRKYGEEKYANHVGKIYKEFIDADKYLTGQYKQGIVYKETINSYIP
jgi:hypothetical protein